MFGMVLTDSVRADPRHELGKSNGVGYLGSTGYADLTSFLYWRNFDSTERAR